MLKLGLNNCWATPIYKTSITEDECSTLVNEIMLSENITKPQSDYDSNSLTDRVPLLKTIAQQKYAEFFKEVLNLDLVNFKYHLKSWLTGSMGGYSMDLHNHSGAPFVSVIYLLAEEQDKGGQLVMHDPRTNANRGFNSEFQHLFSPIEHTPKSGDVLIFPGYVYHSVRQFHSSLRLAVPVDLFIED
jgi:hypothetical protein